MHEPKVKKLRGLLRILSRIESRREIADFLAASNRHSLELISEIFLNLLSGHLPLTPEQVTKLKRYRDVIRYVRRKKLSDKKKRAKLQTGAGLSLLFPLVFPTLAKLLLGGRK